MQSLVICCLVSVLWMIFGFSLAFTPGCAVIGGAKRFWMLGMVRDRRDTILINALNESAFGVSQAP